MRFLGIDRAVFYSIASRGVGALTAPVTLFCIATFLTQAEQGYYYTFSSLLGLTLFLNLGLSNVLLLFASHEKARLNWTPEGNLEGSPEAIHRLSSLFRLGSLWFGVAAALTLAIIFPMGWWFFTSRGADIPIAWHGPWFAATAVTAATLMLTPIMSVLEGCGKVAELRRLSFMTPLVCNPLLWLSLWIGLGLYSGPIFFGAGLLVSLCWIVLKHAPLLRTLAGRSSMQTATLWREAWPLQWRTALSWVSGYLVFQLFNPMLFAFHGPEIAGRMGMSLSLSQTVGGLGLVWVANRIPRMGELWAQRNYRELDRLFLFVLIRAILVTLAASAALWVVAWFLPVVAPQYASRVLPPLPFGLLLVVLPLNNLVFAESFYLRANKQEPFLWLSIGYGAAVLISNLTLGSAFGATGMAAGYLAAASANALIGTGIFLRCRRRWQACSTPS